jgi:hypothetical protein
MHIISKRFRQEQWAVTNSEFERLMGDQATSGTRADTSIATGVWHAHEAESFGTFSLSLSLSIYSRLHFFYTIYSQ